MKKEEILEASKEENKKKDIYELEIERKGAIIAAVVMLILAAVYYCYEIISGKGTNPALYSIITIYCSVMYGYKAIKLERRRGLYAFTSIIWGILTITLILEYFKVLF